MNTTQKLTSNLKPASAQRPALPLQPTGARLSATAPAALSSRDGLNAGARGPAPPVVVADESTRAVLRSHLSAHDRNPFKQEFAIMRGPHGPATPLGDQAGDSVELLGEEKAARHGIVLRILLPDGGSITLRPQLRGPVHPTVITKAKFKWQGKQRPMM